MGPLPAAPASILLPVPCHIQTLFCLANLRTLPRRADPPDGPMASPFLHEWPHPIASPRRKMAAMVKGRERACAGID